MSDEIRPFIPSEKETEELTEELFFDRKDDKHLFILEETMNMGTIVEYIFGYTSTLKVERLSRTSAHGSRR